MTVSSAPSSPTHRATTPRYAEQLAPGPTDTPYRWSTYRSSIGMHEPVPPLVVIVAPVVTTSSDGAAASVEPGPSSVAFAASTPKPRAGVTAAASDNTSSW